MKAFFDNLPDIIAASASSTHAIIVLFVLVVAFVAIVFFRRDPWPVRVTIFVILVVIYLLVLFFLYKYEQPDSDLHEIEAFELDVMRNRIFAQHGRFFCRKDLQEHFEKYDWYKPHVCPDDFKYEWLSDQERQEVNRIHVYQKRTGKISRRTPNCRETLPHCYQ